MFTAPSQDLVRKCCTIFSPRRRGPLFPGGNNFLSHRSTGLTPKKTEPRTHPEASSKSPTRLSHPALAQGPRLGIGGAYDSECRLRRRHSEAKTIRNVVFQPPDQWIGPARELGHLIGMQNRAKHWARKEPRASGRLSSARHSPSPLTPRQKRATQTAPFIRSLSNSKH